MSVIYEGSPLDEYLTEIGQKEEVEAEEISMGTHLPGSLLDTSESNQDARNRWNRFWLSAVNRLPWELLSQLLSVDYSSPPPMKNHSQDMAERFKFTLCSSSLLEPCLPRLHPASIQPPPPDEVPDPPESQPPKSQTQSRYLLSVLLGLFLVLSTSIVFWSFKIMLLVVLLPASAYYLLGQQTPRYSDGESQQYDEEDLRDLDKEALGNLRSFIDCCEEFDQAVAQALSHIQKEEESKSFSPPHRSNIATTMDSSSSILMEVLERSLTTLTPLVSPFEFSLLSVMYSIPPTLAPQPSQSLEEEMTRYPSPERRPSPPPLSAHAPVISARGSPVKPNLTSFTHMPLKIKRQSKCRQRSGSLGSASPPTLIKPSPLSTVRSQDPESLYVKRTIFAPETSHAVSPETLTSSRLSKRQSFHLLSTPSTPSSSLLISALQPSPSTTPLSTKRQSLQNLKYFAPDSPSHPTRHHRASASHSMRSVDQLKLSFRDSVTKNDTQLYAGKIRDSGVAGIDETFAAALGEGSSPPRNSYPAVMSTPNSVQLRQGSLHPLTDSPIQPGGPTHARLLSSYLTLHLRRRQLCCGFLALYKSGSPSYWQQINAIVKSISIAFGASHSSISTALNASKWGGGSSIESPFAPHGIKTREEDRKENISRLRDHLKQLDTALDDVSNDEGWEELREVLADMVKAWERGRAPLQREGAAHVIKTVIERAEAEEEEAAQKLLEKPTMLSQLTAVGEDDQEEVEQPDVPELFPPPGREEVFAADTSSKHSKPLESRFSLPRDERIRLARLEREEKIAQKENVQSGDGMGDVVLELKGLMGALRSAKRGEEDEDYENNATNLQQTPAPAPKRVLDDASSTNLRHNRDSTSQSSHMLIRHLPPPFKLPLPPPRSLPSLSSGSGSSGDEDEEGDHLIAD